MTCMWSRTAMPFSTSPANAVCGSSHETCDFMSSDLVCYSRRLCDRMKPKSLSYDSLSSGNGISFGFAHSHLEIFC